MLGGDGGWVEGAKVWWCFGYVMTVRYLALAVALHISMYKNTTKPTLVSRDFRQICIIACNLDDIPLDELGHCAAGWSI